MRSLKAWGTCDFEGQLKEEIIALGPEVLPLQQGLTTGSIALTDKLGVMILNVTEAPDSLRVRAGLFYTSIIAGCACADDPTPVDEHAEYCEVELEIDRHTGELRACLLKE
jgi:hypothetical protein